jgi:general secretion pathway protein G
MENNQDKGFTLVELLIVIVILGILATVTVFAVRGITDKGQENACSVELRTLGLLRRRWCHRGGPRARRHHSWH